MHLALLLRIQSMCQGVSGVRPEVVRWLVKMFDSGWLPRVPEAHGHLHEECTKQGVKLIMGEEIVSTDADGRMVTKKGKKLGPAGARTYWCTGYKPNNSYIKDYGSPEAKARTEVSFLIEWFDIAVAVHF